MSDLSRPLINLTHIEHIGMVVRDIEKSMERLWRLCGLGPWNVFVRESASEVIYRGKPVTCGFIEASTKMGGMSIELFQPTHGESTWAEVLAKHGENIHHLGYTPVDSFDALNDTIRELEKQGFPCIMSMRGPNGALAYIDTTSLLNTLIEVRWRDTSRKLAPPSRVFSPSTSSK
jgi:methylmalonyl-CoA/ethylmalonyl-CoA epimerase